jgi:zinc protease
MGVFRVTGSKIVQRNISLALLLTAAIPLANPALAAAPTWPTAPGLAADPAFRTGVLPNGMRYAIRRNATPPGTAVLRLRIDTGSINEAENQRGLAHFLEHMVLNGTKNVPEGEFVKRLERSGLKFGPDTNASTDFEETLFKLDLPSSKAENVDEALFLLREVADRATLETAAIDRERGIILSEERSRDVPQLRAFVDQLQFLFPGQRIGQRLPIGQVEVIRTAPRERLLAYYNAFYRPENATLVAVGDFDVAEMERKIRAGFADWKGEGAAGVPAAQGRPQVRGPAADIFVDPALPTQATLSWVRPADLSPDGRTGRVTDWHELIGLTVLNERLGRLVTSSNPPPFAGAQAASVQLADSGDLTQILAVARPGEWQPALAALEQEQRRIVQHGPTTAELAQAVASLRSALSRAAAGADTRTNAALADAKIASLGDSRVVTSPAADLALFEEAAKDLTPAVVTAAMRGVFAGTGPLVSLASPTPIAGGEGAVLAALNTSTRVAVAAPIERKAAAWPYTSFGTPGAVKNRQEFAALGSTVVTFANNVRLIVRPSTAGKDEVLVRVRVGDGRLDLPTDRAVATALLQLGGLQLGGTGKLAAEDIQQALAGRQVTANFRVAENAFEFDGTTRPADLGIQLQLLTASIVDPGWRPEGWEQLRQVSGSLSDRYASTPGGVLERDLQSQLRAGDQRWATPDRGALTKTSIQDIRAVLADPFASDPIEVIIAGDVTIDEAIQQTAATFGALPVRQAVRTTPQGIAFPTGSAEPVVLRHKGRADQGAALIAWPTQGLDKDIRTSRTLSLLAEVYQLRLTNKIREEQGATYSPTALSNGSEAFDNFGFLLGLIEAPPAALPRFLADAQAIAAQLASQPVSADELLRARKPLVERLQRDRAGNAWWLNALDGLGRDPRVKSRIEGQISLLEGVTPADLQAAARRFLAARSAYRLVVLPEGAGSSQ